MTVKALEMIEADEVLPQGKPVLVKPNYINARHPSTGITTDSRVIEGVGWLKWGDVRANLIESVLGFALRKLEMELQPGTGMGHGLVGIFEIRK